MVDTPSPSILDAVKKRLEILKENKALAEQTLASLDANREQLVARVHAHTGAIEQIEQVLSMDLKEVVADVEGKLLPEPVKEPEANGQAA